MDEIKVGDRVKCLYHYKSKFMGEVGTVEEVNYNCFTFPYLVKFDNYENRICLNSKEIEKLREM